MSSSSFDVEIEYEGHTLQVKGVALPYIPATGPTMDGPGDPAEGGEIEDLEVTILWRAPIKVWRHRKLCQAITDGLDLDDLIREKLAEESDDR